MNKAERREAIAKELAEKEAKGYLKKYECQVCGNTITTAGNRVPYCRCGQGGECKLIHQEEVSK